MTVDIHTPLADYIATSRQQDAGYRYGDGVHPPLDGHLAFALAILNGIGESSEKAHQLLTQLNGVDLKTNPGARDAARNPKPALEIHFGPIQPLSRAYRENTFPGLNREPLSLGEIFEKAEQQESELRTRIHRQLHP